MKYVDFIDIPENNTLLTSKLFWNVEGWIVEHGKVTLKEWLNNLKTTKLQQLYPT